MAGENSLTQERAYWLAWSQILGVGAVLLRRIHLHFGSLATAWQAPLLSLGEVEGLGNKVLQEVEQARSRLHPDELLQTHLQKNPSFWTPADAEYPQLLLETPSPPPLLYYTGKASKAENLGKTPLIGIVGTRYPTDYGQRWTRKISATLANNGFTVVSGMANGIDTQAHWGCLEAGGRTIAVVGTGVDKVYPANNRKLYEQIQQQGIVISEYAAGTPPDRGNFPARNRIIAGLCRAVLVIEAPTKSGALITARYANDFNRDVYALPGSLDNAQSIGCLELINRGAQMILSETHLLEMLGAIPPLDSAVQLSLLEVAPPPDLKPEFAKVFQATGSEPTPFDIIVQQSGLDTGTVSGALLELELMGFISSVPGMRYQRI